MFFEKCVDNAAIVKLWQVTTIRITELKLHCASVGVNQVGIQKLENCKNDVFVVEIFSFMPCRLWKSCKKPQKVTPLPIMLTNSVMNESGSELIIAGVKNVEEAWKMHGFSIHVDKNNFQEGRMSEDSIAHYKMAGMSEEFVRLFSENLPHYVKAIHHAEVLNKKIVTINSTLLEVFHEMEFYSMVRRVALAYHMEDNKTLNVWFEIPSLDMLESCYKLEYRVNSKLIDIEASINVYADLAEEGMQAPADFFQVFPTANSEEDGE